MAAMHSVARSVPSLLLVAALLLASHRWTGVQGGAPGPPGPRPEPCRSGLRGPDPPAREGCLSQCIPPHSPDNKFVCYKVSYDSSGKCKLEADNFPQVFRTPSKKVAFVYNPNYLTGQYKPNQLCVWNVPPASPSTTYAYVLVDKSMARYSWDPPNCACVDHLSVSHGSSTVFVCGSPTYPPSDISCQYGPPTCLHPSGYLITSERTQIVFRSNGYGEDRGFLLVVLEICSNCGPPGPVTVPPHEDCPPPPTGSPRGSPGPKGPRGRRGSGSCACTGTCTVYPKSHLPAQQRKLIFESDKARVIREIVKDQTGNKAWNYANSPSSDLLRVARAVLRDWDRLT